MFISDFAIKKPLITVVSMVTLGVRDSETDRVEITGGVAAGDTLLVGAALGTSPGTRVTVRAGGAAPAAR